MLLVDCAQQWSSEPGYHILKRSSRLAHINKLIVREMAWVNSLWTLDKCNWTNFPFKTRCKYCRLIGPEKRWPMDLISWTGLLKNYHHVGGNDITEGAKMGKASWQKYFLLRRTSDDGTAERRVLSNHVSHRRHLLSVLCIRVSILSRCSQNYILGVDYTWKMFVMYWIMFTRP